MASELIWETPIGPLRAVIGAQGVRRLEFAPPAENYPISTGAIHVSQRKDDSSDINDASAINEHARLLSEFLQTYFSGETPRALPALDLAGVSKFHQKVLHECGKIGFGCTASYGELARTVGSPNAARAVGGAMARNPVPLVIPCHRVVATGRSRLGGFGGGLALKRWLLDHERQTGKKRAEPAGF